MIKLRSNDNLIAYFSMEIGIDQEIPTYAGGLGILAGDILRSFADLGVPGIGVTLLSEFGYFTQNINEQHVQIESYDRWDIEKFLEKLDPEITIPLGKSVLNLKLWQYTITGLGGRKVPIIFLDANHPNNSNEHKKLTQRLYPANPEFRFVQEIILGIGGVQALNALGHKPTIYHLNEGHPALLSLQLLKEATAQHITEPLRKVRSQCVFTTHTPVEAGHDRFKLELVKKYLTQDYYKILQTVPDVFEETTNDLNMTKLALSTSSKFNGVAQKHAEVSNQMFPEYRFNAITNGIHHTFWASPPLYMLFDEYLPGWQNDPFALLGVSNIPAELIERAHHENKRRLMDFVRTHFQNNFSDDIFTIGYARRFTKYKRPDLLFYDLDRIKRIAEEYPIQIIFAGKAHPNDEVGKSILKEIISLATKFGPNIRLAFINDYNINLAKMIISGVDIWLNTPQRPMEASGTSGMKASLNGVPNVSILDGWWLEGHVEGVTGWSMGRNPVRHRQTETQYSDSEDAEDLFRKLEFNILPTFYNNEPAFMRIRRNCIGLHGSYFNTHRAVQEYILKSYLG